MTENSTKKILVADDEEGIRDVYCMIIESNFDYEILTAECAADAIELIKQNGGKIDLIFSDYNMKKDTGGDLYKFLVEKSLNIPFTLCSTYSPSDIEAFEGFETDHPNNAYFQKPFTSEQIVSHINKVFHDSQAATKDIGTFVKVRPERFMRVNQIKETFNVYIRLSMKKFVKIINEGETESFDVIEKYINKGIDFIYLEWQKYEVFEEVALTSLFSDLEALNEKTGEEYPVNEGTALVVDAISSVQGLVKTVGVNERTIEHIDSVVSATEEIIKKSNQLGDLLDLLISREGYLKDHAYLTSFLACSIAEKMSWKTEGIWKKIIMASLFQNISLENEEHAKIYDLGSEEYKKLDDSDKTKIKLHPQDSIKMLTDADEYFSEDTRKMIQNHHELPSGKGYPRGLDASKVAPLEALFILSANFAHSLLCAKDMGQVKILVQKYNEQFNTGNYKKPYQGFLKAFINIDFNS